MRRGMRFRPSDILKCVPRNAAAGVATEAAPTTRSWRAAERSTAYHNVSRAASSVTRGQTGDERPAGRAEEAMPTIRAMRADSLERFFLDLREAVLSPAPSPGGPPLW